MHHELSCAKDPPTWRSNGLRMDTPCPLLSISFPAFISFQNDIINSFSASFPTPHLHTLSTRIMCALSVVKPRILHVILCVSYRACSVTASAFHAHLSLSPSLTHTHTHTYTYTHVHTLSYHAHIFCAHHKANLSQAITTPANISFMMQSHPFTDQRQAGPAAVARHITHHIISHHTLHLTS